jgi:RsiW-degrading membrane proteinase PrsW (M82 family)
LDHLIPLLAVLPGVLISYIIFRVDKYEREPFVPLAICFIAGALLTLPAVVLEKRVFDEVDNFHRQGVAQALLMAFVVVALQEELLKFLALRYIPFPRAFFNEPLDGIVYAVLIAMGFAAMENIAYADRFGVETLFLRSLTAVPAHFVFAIIQGYYAGLAKFDPARRKFLLGKGLFLAILLHGMYDFLIFLNWSDWLFVLATMSLYLCLFYTSVMIRKHLDNSPFRNKIH